jgi:hypothetical protein
LAGDEKESEEIISTATKTRPAQWTCARCEMTSTWTNGCDTSAPPNWEKQNGLYYCLSCRRERAVEKALDKAGDIGIEARAKVRSSAVVKFEILRDPDRTEGEIAKAARTSIGAVRKARREVAGGH